ncbi:MAG TPA: hypothetical protein VMU05_04900 [Dongiaceae bacterium]|nr:hypothetical protein [Dongiaceae bacterium]
MARARRITANLDGVSLARAARDAHDQKEEDISTERGAKNDEDGREQLPGNARL